MFRFGGLVLPNSKTAVLAAVSLLLAIAGIAAVRQLTSAQAAPASGPSIIHSVDLSSSPASTNNSPAQPIDTNQGANSSQTSVTVNGQSVDVPENGSTSQTIQSDGGSTTVNVQSSHSSTRTGQAGNTNRSSLNVNVHSSSSENSL
jgi:hypothetical protein